MGKHASETVLTELKDFKLSHESVDFGPDGIGFHFIVDNFFKFSDIPIASVFIECDIGAFVRILFSFA